jgi:Uncharacterized protein conserved in bacteria
MLSAEIMKQLQAPFPGSEIKLKIQAKLKSDPTKAIVVAYIDARNVMERLDEVSLTWSDTYREVNLGTKTGIECQLTVEGLTRSDVGDPESDGMDSSLKSAYSDAFKRAAVKFGIGRFLYSLPKMYAKVDGNFIDKSELPRLREVIDNSLYNAGVQKEGVTPRVWSLDLMEEVIKSGVCDNHEDAKSILDASILPEGVTLKTVETWAKYYAKAGKDSVVECAEVANKAYLKAKASKK